MLSSFFFGKHVEEDEEILLVVHKHWLIGTKELWLPTSIFIMLWGILVARHSLALFYGISLSSLAVAIWWIQRFMDYYLDTWIITSKGIIDLEWRGWFHRSASRTLYSDVQGIGYETIGVWSSLFRYGTVAIERLSGDPLTMDYVPKPRHTEIVVLEAMEKYVLEKNLADAKTVQNILAEFVASSIRKEQVASLVQEKSSKKS